MRALLKYQNLKFHFWLIQNFICIWNTNNYIKRHVKMYDIAWQVIRVSFSYATFAFSSPAYMVPLYGQVFSRFPSSFDMGFAFGIKDSIPNLNTFSSVPFPPTPSPFISGECLRTGNRGLCVIKDFFGIKNVCAFPFEASWKIDKLIISLKMRPD